MTIARKVFDRQPLFIRQGALQLWGCHWLPVRNYAGPDAYTVLVASLWRPVMSMEPRSSPACARLVNPRV